MPKRRLPIDVTAVARAMDAEDRAAVDYLLDTHTGEVLVLARAALEAVQDGGSPPADTLPEELSRVKAVVRAKPGHFIVIPQRPPPDMFDVMQRFVASVVDPDLQRNLERALGGAAPFRRFREVLSDDLVEEERWEGYGAAVREIEAREWLAELDLQPME